MESASRKRRAELLRARPTTELMSLCAAHGLPLGGVPTSQARPPVDAHQLPDAVTCWRVCSAGPRGAHGKEALVVRLAAHPLVSPSRQRVCVVGDGLAALRCAGCVAKGIQAASGTVTVHATPVAVHPGTANALFTSEAMTPLFKKGIGGTSRDRS